MIGYIYKTTNTVNGKIYVGQKKSDKFLKEQYLVSGKILQQAVEKYGKDCFTVCLLDTADTLEELGERERFWIKELKSQDPNIGYNITPGGIHVPLDKEANGFYGKHHSEETKQHLREMAKTRSPMSEETKEKIRQKHLGSHRSEETKQKMSSIQQGRQCYTDGTVIRYFFPDREEIPEGFYPGIPQAVKDKISSSGKGREVSEKTRQLLTEKNRTRWDSYSEEERELIRQHMRNAEKRCNGGGEYWKGKHRPTPPDDVRDKISKTMKNKIWVTDSEHAMMINKEDLDTYISQGYRRGRK